MRGAAKIPLPVLGGPCPSVSVRDPPLHALPLRDLHERMRRDGRSPLAEYPADPMAVVDLLLAASRACRYDDVSRMVYLAELAQGAADRLEGERHGVAAVADVR